VVWGARTMRGASVLADDFAYVPVRRLFLHVENWVIANTKWAAFAPNDAQLWSMLTQQVATFMTGLWRQGAFFGTKASEAFFVRCDSSTTTPDDIKNGRANIQIGFAPIRPAEFVVAAIAVKTAAG